MTQSGAVGAHRNREYLEPSSRSEWRYPATVLAGVALILLVLEPDEHLNLALLLLVGAAAIALYGTALVLAWRTGTSKTRSQSPLLRVF